MSAGYYVIIWLMESVTMIHILGVALIGWSAAEKALQKDKENIQLDVENYFTFILLPTYILWG